MIDSQSGAHLWADRFDGTLEDVFDLQDQVTSRVVSTIGPTIERAEIVRSSSKPTEFLQAYEHHLRGLAHFYKFARDANETAFDHFQRAAEIDSDYARPLIMSAMCYAMRRAMGWTTDIDQEKLKAEAWTRQALQLDPRDSLVLGRAACVLSYVVRKLEESSSLLDRALELDSNDAFAWSWSGWTQIWLGHPEDAITRFKNALRLNPLDPQLVFTYTGMAAAHFAMSRYPEAETWAKKARQELPDYPAALRALIAIQASVGNIEQAKASVETYLQRDPAARTSTMRQSFFPGMRGEWVEKYLRGFRLAGLPE